MVPGSRCSPALAAGLVLLCISGCAAGITRDELLEQMQRGVSSMIVDVRSRGEYDSGHLPGAVPVSFYSVISGMREQNISDHEPIVLYCEHGPRSGIAAMLLYLAGYRNVFSLDGHMKGWRGNGFPIETVVP